MQRRGARLESGGANRVRARMLPAAEGARVPVAMPDTLKPGARCRCCGHELLMTYRTWKGNGRGGGTCKVEFHHAHFHIPDLAKPHVRIYPWDAAEALVAAGLI